MLRVFAVVCAVAAAPDGARAAPFTRGNVLFSNQTPFRDQLLMEFTPGGQFVQQIVVPTDFGVGIRDLVIDQAGDVQIYTPQFITTYRPATGTFSTQPSVHSSAGNLTYGGIATGGDYVFASDMNTNESEEVGIVRYHRAGGTPQRFMPQIEYIDVNVGRDGLLYGVRYDGIHAGGFNVDVVNPFTGQHLQTIALADVVRAVAVDAAGNLYGADRENNRIVKYDRTGARLDGITAAFGGLADVDLDDAGNLLVGSHAGWVNVTTTALDSVTAFQARSSDDTNFVAWAVPPPALVPEPSAAVVGLCAAGWLGLSRRRR
jgi:hypothetical protein